MENSYDRNYNYSFFTLFWKVLGKVGKISRFTTKKDVVVSFGNKHWVFNKACLIPAPGEKVFEIKEEEDFSLSRGKFNVASCFLLINLEHLY